LADASRGFQFSLRRWVRQIQLLERIDREVMSLRIPADPGQVRQGGVPFHASGIDSASLAKLSIGSQKVS
jgi:hypothetical protein